MKLMPVFLILHHDGKKRLVNLYEISMIKECPRSFYASTILIDGEENDFDESVEKIEDFIINAHSHLDKYLGGTE